MKLSITKEYLEEDIPNLNEDYALELFIEDIASGNYRIKVNNTKTPTQEQIENYVRWILEDSSNPYDEIEWLIEKASAYPEVNEAILNVNGEEL